MCFGRMQSADAEVLLQQLQHPAVAGLQSEAVWLAEHPALRRIVELVRKQVSRLRRGEVSTALYAPTSTVCFHIIRTLETMHD